MDSSQFWGADSYHNPPLSKEVLIEAERILGVAFPVELIALWELQNGGYARVAYVWLV